MKLTTLLLVATILQVSASTFAQKVTLSEKNTPLTKVFERISDQTGYDFIVSTESLTQSKTVTINLQNEELHSALNKIFAAQPLTFVIQEKMIVVSKKQVIVTNYDNENTARELVVTGKVTDATGLPLPGATVRVKGQSQGAITANDGTFTFTTNLKEVVLQVSFVGYKPAETRITPPVMQPIVIVLQADDNVLNQVQVIGYGTTTKFLNTGSASTITAKELEKQPVTNILSALSGRITGLNVQTSNGLPGGNVNIQVRGRGSISAGTEPLYIVDGIPFASSVIAPNSTLSISAINGVISPFNSLNPNDIESITVLKDADATAIYGSRGSNGVILITTKKGHSGKTEVNFTVSTGASKVANLPKLLNLKDYLKIRREAFRNDGLTPSANPLDAGYAPDLMVWDTTKSTDWRKYFLGKTAHLTDMQGTVSGGNTNTTFMIGGNYHEEGTILPGDNRYQRGGAHVLLQHTTENQKFNIQFNSTYNSDNNRLANISSNFIYDLLLPPNFPLREQAGGFNYFLGFNPLADASALSKTQTNNLLINSLGSYAISKELRLKASAGFSRIDINQLMTFPTSAQYEGSTNYSDFGKTSNQNFIIEPQINFARAYGRININLLAGGTYQSTLKKSQFIEAHNFNSDLFLENLGSATNSTLFNSEIQYKYLSAFGRANLNFDDRYVVNASIRRDGSSRFGPGNQFGTFWALGAAWIFTNEQWVKNHPGILSYGKLRGSIGKTGNDQISDYQYLSAYANSGYVYQGTATIGPARLANPNFHWETTQKAEVALELGFFKDRIIGIVDHYNNRTSDQLVNYAVPALTGFNSYQANLPAKVENSGWEFELHTQNIKKAKFSWTTTFNLTIPKNKLLSFKDLATSSYANTLVIGDPITRAYGYQFAGIDATGLPTYQTISGATTNSPSSVTDQYFTLGKGYPDYYGGIGNQLTIGNWSIDVFGQFVKQITKGGLIYTPGISYNNFSSAVNRWQKTGDITRIPKSSTSFAYFSVYDQSSANYFNTSFFRLKTIALSYNLPDAWLRRFSIKRLRLFAQGQNMFTIWNHDNPVYDPETGAGGNIPPMKSLVAGINVTF